ncbi:MAG: hypothetical protein PVSMB1_04990 [Gemmatimonadaceae bacterium]
MPTTRDECIAEVMRDFNFDKVHAAMVAVGWKWRQDDGESLKIPTRDDLVKTARDLLGMAWDHKDTIRTGGFAASFDPGDEATARLPNLGLWFTIASVDVGVGP